MPAILSSAPRTLNVSHFPEVVHPTIDPNQEGTYFWKHTTTVIAKKSDVQIKKCGAYVYYNNQWNLRAEFDKKQFSAWFNCPDALMEKGEAYTFPENWRMGEDIYAGWALWYFLGEDKNGDEVIGYEMLYTSDKEDLLPPQASIYALDKAQSQCRWTGKAAFSLYPLSGEVIVQSGHLTVAENAIMDAALEIDLRTIKSDDYEDLTDHLKSKDFFHTKKYPTARFSLVRPVDLQNSSSELEGAFTIKEHTQVEAFNIEVEPTGNGIWLKGTIELDRTAYGVVYNSPSIFQGVGENAIADVFEMRFSLFFRED